MPRNTYADEEKVRFVEQANRATLVTGSENLSQFARRIGTTPARIRDWCRRYSEMKARLQDKKGTLQRNRQDPEQVRREKRKRQLARTARRMFSMGFDIPEVCEHLTINRWALMDMLQNEFLRDIQRKARVRRPYTFKKNIRQYQPKYVADMRLNKRLDELDTPPAVTEIYEGLKAEYQTTTLHQRLIMQDIARHSYVCSLCMEQLDSIEFHHMIGYVGTEQHMYAWTKAYQRSAERMRLSLKLLGVKLGTRKKARTVTSPRAGKIKLTGD